MIGTSPGKKRNPILGFLIPIISLIVFAGLCFLLCDALYLLNQQGVK